MQIYAKSSNFGKRSQKMTMSAMSDSMPIMKNVPAVIFRSCAARTDLLRVDIKNVGHGGEKSY